MYSAKHTVVSGSLRRVCVSRKITKVPPSAEIANENKQGRRLITQDGSAVLVKRSYFKNVLLNGTWPGLSLR